MKENSFLIVGLGNPGREYRDTRHNIGFMLVDRIAVRLNLGFRRLQFKALVASGDYAGNSIILAKPQTFMNLSGQAVSALIRFYKLPLINLMVVHDHLDLPYGTIRIRPDGGAGGQLGLESIIDRLGTQQFPRMRLGIGRPPGRMDPAAYVLQEFPAGDIDSLSQMLDRAADAIFRWIDDSLDEAMTHFNTSETFND